jgi:hypothetical protein
MKVISIQVYSLQELKEINKKAYSKALDNIIELQNNSFDYDEANGSMDKFVNETNLKLTRNGEITCYYVDDSIRELKGVRLATWINNNWGHFLWTPKIYWNQKTKKCRYSKIQKDNCCTLTGVCYDHDILDPIYKFLLNPRKNWDLDDVISEINNNYERCISNINDWITSEDYAVEMAEANEYKFLLNGNIF